MARHRHRSPIPRCDRANVIMANRAIRDRVAMEETRQLVEIDMGGQQVPASEIEQNGARGEENPGVTATITNKNTPQTPRAENQIEKSLLFEVSYKVTPLPPDLLSRNRIHFTRVTRSQSINPPARFIPAALQNQLDRQCTAGPREQSTACKRRQRS